MYIDSVLKEKYEISLGLKLLILERYGRYNEYSSDCECENENKRVSEVHEEVDKFVNRFLFEFPPPKQETKNPAWYSLLKG